MGDDRREELEVPSAKRARVNAGGKNSKSCLNVAPRCDIVSNQICSSGALTLGLLPSTDPLAHYGAQFATALQNYFSYSNNESQEYALEALLSDAVGRPRPTTACAS